MRRKGSGTVTLLGALFAPAIAASQCLPAERVPLPVLGQGEYKGEQGGLYPGGANQPPVEHRDDINRLAAQIVPRDGAGAADPSGMIGFLNVGFSNPTQEFGAFVHGANAGAGRNARIVFVNGSQGGIDATKAIDVDPQTGTNAYWDGVHAKVAAAGLSDAQIEVCWLKTSKQGPSGCFPGPAADLLEQMKTLVQIVHDHFPNVKICYLSSRIYGGYAPAGGNPEPFAYEEGFAAKWLIEAQIADDPALNYGQLPGEIEAPLLLWGPYLWANGEEIPYGDLVWLPEDFEDGGLNQHPSEQGEQKVADRLAAFFATNPSAGRWWPQQADAQLLTLTPTADAFVRACACPGCPNFGADPQLRVQRDQEVSYLTFDASAVSAPIVHAALGLRIDPLENGGDVTVQRVDDTGWSELSITWCKAPSPAAILGAIPGRYSRGGFVSFDVTADLQSDADGVVSFRLEGIGPGLRAFLSKEKAAGAGHEFPGQLILTVLAP